MNIKNTHNARLFAMFQVGMNLIAGILLVLMFWYPISWLWICTSLALSLLSDMIFFMFYNTHNHSENNS